MGKNLHQKNAGISMKDNGPGCMWGIFHVLHYHRWNHVKKMFPNKWHGGGRHGMGVENSGTRINCSGIDEMQEDFDAATGTSITEENMTESNPGTKSSMKSRLKALFSEDTSRRKGRHRRSSSDPTRMQLTRTNSIHHLEAFELDFLAEAALNEESPKFIHQGNEESNSASKLDVLQSKTYEVPAASNSKCELCAAILALNYWGQSHVDEHGEVPDENYTILQQKLKKEREELLEQKQIYQKKPCQSVSIHKPNQSVDSLDIFNMNEELILKILYDPSSPLLCDAHDQQVFNSKIRLTKSVSFPLASKFGRKAIGSIGTRKLKHKKESEAFAKGNDKSQVSSQSRKTDKVGSREDVRGCSVPERAKYREDSISKPHREKLETFDNFAPGSPVRPKNRHETNVALKHFKNLKQKIKHAIKESKKERRITMDAFFHKVPYGRRLSKNAKEEIADFWKDRSMEKCCRYSPGSSCENDHSVSALGKGRRRNFRRTSSLDESLDRYRQLFECSFNKEAKQHISDRLNSRMDEMLSPGGSAPKFLGRILSLPDLWSCSNTHNDDPNNANSLGTPTRTAMTRIMNRGSSRRFDEQKSDKASENETQFGAPVENGKQKILIDVGESCPVTENEVGITSLAKDEVNAKASYPHDDLANLTTGENPSHNEHEICYATKLTEPSPISVVDCNFQEDIASPAKFSISEDLELHQRRLFSDGADTLESLANQKHDVGMDTPRVADSRVNLGIKETHTELFNFDLAQVQVDMRDLDDFHYIRDVLELSGFNRNQFLGSWHSVDQPVDSSVFEELEGSLLTKPDCSEIEEDRIRYHLLLFDIINEALLEIYERSFTYWPMLLTSCSLVHPMPVGYHVLEEVWANISWYLSWRSKEEQLVDDGVSRDLAKSDGWMNLQSNAECVGLELEDMILDDLLDELVWS